MFWSDNNNESAFLLIQNADMVGLSGKSSQLAQLVQLAKCTPYQHLDYNISHDLYLPGTLRSMKQLRLSILPKDTNTMALARLELTTLMI